MNAPRLSACIVCFNEEKNIADCIQSVSFADEIIVVDSVSSDRTVEIAKQFTDNVSRQAWLGNIKQKNLALSKAHGEWLLLLDADERITGELKAKIIDAISSPGAADGYRFPRKNYFIGKWMRYGGWYPDHVIRLFRSGKAQMGGVDPHDKAVVDGNVETIDIPILHYTYTSFQQYVSKQFQWSAASARELYKKNPEKSVLPYLVIKPVTKFLETYFLKRGFLDGFHGFLAACGASFFAFTKYVCLWELQKNFKNNLPPRH